jgi:hypothetical protein
VPRRFLLAFALLALAAIPAIPAFAGSRVIAQKTAPQPNRAVYLSHWLAAGHRYQISVSALGHARFQGYVMEQYTYVVSKHLYTGSKTIALNGTAPRSFAMSQPVSGRLTEWVLVADVQPLRSARLTVRLADLGSHR